MFGFELQSKNVFVTGCEERQVAFRNASGTVTLEADEGHLQDGSTDLEFVTAPCHDWQSAGKLLGIAADWARILAKRAQSAGNTLEVKKGDDAELGGTWSRNCVIKVTDPSFTAAIQGTVGVPLGGLPRLIETTFTRIDPQEKTTKEQWEKIRYRTDRIPGVDKTSGPLRGFLTACHMFLLRATEVNPKNQLWGTYVTDITPMEGYRVFDMSENKHVAELGIFGFNGKDLVVVQADGPKVLFPLLHRTDFRHMFLSLSSDEQKWVMNAFSSGALTQDVNKYWNLFPYPYRGEEEAADIDKRAPGLWARIPEYTRDDKPVTWMLITHGPTVADWWSSVLNGDANRNYLAKDNASPPPGWRGRDPGRIDRFPSSTEDKSTYYGMGAFPIDTSADPPLAVFEHRYFGSDVGMTEKYPVVDNWIKACKIFYDNYVPKPLGIFWKKRRRKPVPYFPRGPFIPRHSAQPPTT